MRDLTGSNSPSQSDTGRANAEMRDLRGEVDELLRSAHDDATADLDPVVRGCHNADILTRGQDIRARHGLPPNPVAAREPGASRESQVLAARERLGDRIRGRQRGRGERSTGSRTSSASDQPLWQLSQMVSQRVPWMRRGG